MRIFREVLIGFYQKNPEIILRCAMGSRKMCTVPQCTSRADTQTGISLHDFPNETDPRRKVWIERFKIGKELPKNAKACSKYFADRSHLGNRED